MKKINLILLLLITHVVFSQKNANSAIISNKVKEVRIIDKNNKVVSISKYDNNGRLIFTSADNFTYAVFLKTSETISYNNDGKINKTISTHSSFEKPTIFINNYDSNWNLISIQDESGKQIFKYFYNDTNFKIREQQYDDRNKIEETITYEKSSDGKKVVQSIEGNFIKKRKNISFYDQNWNEIRSESYDNGILYFSTENIFLNNRVVKETYKEKSGISGNNYYYDNQERLTKRELFNMENGKELIGNSESFEYFDNGLIKKYIENIYSISELGEFKYEYDFRE